MPPGSRLVKKLHVFATFRGTLDLLLHIQRFNTSRLRCVRYWEEYGLGILVAL